MRGDVDAAERASIEDAVKNSWAASLPDIDPSEIQITLARKEPYITTGDKPYV